MTDTTDRDPLTVLSSDRKPATVGSIAAMEFQGVREFVEMSKTDRLRNVHVLA